MYWVSCVVILYFAMLILSLSALNVCPSICNNIACQNGVLSCSQSGLTSIPPVLPPQTNKVVLIHQDFSKAGDLSYHNISNYGPPDYEIKNLTIQHSKLMGIAPETFSHLFHLTTLDFSYNLITTIQPRTFESLNLNYLRLDGNHYVKLHCLSFNKAIIRNLSLINCSLTYLDYCTLKPIAGVLHKLILSHNKLQTISSKFEYLFQRLSELRLNNNPLDCSQCKLNWLSNLLSVRFQKLDYIKSKSELENIYPKCHNPSYLAGKFVNNVITNKNKQNISCNNPSIKSINLKFYSYIKLQIVCLPSNPLDYVIWIYRLNNDIIYYRQQQLDLIMQKNQRYLNLSCLIGNFNINVSTNIKITWPNLVLGNRKVYNSTKPYSMSTKIPRINHKNGFAYSPQFSLMELLGAIFGSFALFLILFTVGMKHLLVRDSLCEKSKPLDIYYQHHLQQQNRLNPSLCEQNASLIVECKQPVSHDYYFESQEPQYPNSHNTWDFLKYEANNNNNNNNNNQIYDTPKLSNSIFLDYKTHQRIPAS